MNSLTLDDLPEVMSLEQAAKYWNVCRATAYNWCNTGKVASFKVGNVRRIRKSSLVALMDQLEAESIMPKSGQVT